MSLINDMLRDLEKRKKKETRNLPCSETPMVVDKDISSPKILILAGGTLLLVVVLWLGVQLIPGSLPVSTKGQYSSAQHIAVPETVVKNAVVAKTVPIDVVSESRKQQLGAIEAVKDKEPAVTQPSEAAILNLGVVESKDAAQLSLSFVQLPEYRVLQNGTGNAQLVVSFKHTRIAENFEIPPLSGTLLKRISLLPQKQTMQLLVDLDERAQVQSFQSVGDSEHGYRLLIDIIAPVPVIAKPEKKKSSPAVTTQTVELPAARIESEVAKTSKKTSKNKNTLSSEQQAYQAGLQQLKTGHLNIAEESFAQALLINPKLLDARLQLVQILQQQMKLEKAEEQLLLGLSLLPGNTDLRKTYARLLLKNQRHAEALDILKTAPIPLMAQDMEYHALLAALLQESGQFTAASSIYSQLVQIRPQETVWWMGMAISLEQSGNFDQARNAYQKALSLPGLRADLRSYIQSRLQVL